MNNKTLRILIADTNHEQLLHIEKRLNALDYYRIAPVRTFDELVQLTSSPNELFDLLIVNKTLSLPYGVDIAEFCHARPQILHAFFYESPTKTLELVLESPDQFVHASLTDTPDSISLNVLMNIIDSPLQWASLKSLPWLRESTATNG